MHRLQTVPAARRASRVARAATAVLLALVAAACATSTDELLSITDPDIINPSDVQSQAGASSVRTGALVRLNSATTGGEGVIQLGGLLADEWRSGDSFIARDEIDQRQVTRENSFLTTANRNLHRARLTAELATQLLAKYSVGAPGWQPAEMYFVEAYVENLMAESYCSGIVFSTLENGVEAYGAPLTTTATLERALVHADSGLKMITGTTTDDNRVKYALQVVKGRILLNLNRYAEAATAVAAVPTTASYQIFHATTNQNQIWAMNNSARRYNLSAGEGPLGANYATANDARVPACQGGSTLCKSNGISQTLPFDNTTVIPFYAQLIWPTDGSPVKIVSGVDARLIEAEAQLKAGSAAGALATLNALRATVTGLAPLADAGTQAAREDQLFREKAFWTFGRGYRLGDMRRLIRQYGRSASAVFPTGAFHKGGNYGPDVNFPIPQAEDNNPNAKGCIDRNA